MKRHQNMHWTWTVWLIIFTLERIFSPREAILLWNSRLNSNYGFLSSRPRISPVTSHYSSHRKNQNQINFFFPLSFPFSAVQATNDDNLQRDLDIHSCEYFSRRAHTREMFWPEQWQPTTRLRFISDNWTSRAAYKNWSHSCARHRKLE